MFLRDKWIRHIALIALRLEPLDQLSVEIFASAEDRVLPRVKRIGILPAFDARHAHQQVGGLRERAVSAPAPIHLAFGPQPNLRRVDKEALGIVVLREGGRKEVDPTRIGFGVRAELRPVPSAREQFLEQRGVATVAAFESRTVGGVDPFARRALHQNGASGERLA